MWTTFAEFEDLSAFCDGVPMIHGPPKHRFRVLFFPFLRLWMLQGCDCFYHESLWITLKACSPKPRSMYGETNLLLSISWSSKMFSLFLLPFGFCFSPNSIARLSTNYHNKIKHVQAEIRSSTCFFCYNFKFILNLMLKRFGFIF